MGYINQQCEMSANLGGTPISDEEPTANWALPQFTLEGEVASNPSSNLHPEDDDEPTQVFSKAILERATQDHASDSSRTLDHASDGPRTLPAPPRPKAPSVSDEPMRLATPTEITRISRRSAKGQALPPQLLLWGAAGALSVTLLLLLAL